MIIAHQCVNIVYLFLHQGNAVGVPRAARLGQGPKRPSPPGLGADDGVDHAALDVAAADPEAPLESVSVRLKHSLNF